jgi:RimJ/RimL family protein N-acetyltransferase
MPIWLETERLVLRQFRLNEWKNVYRYASNPEVWKYIDEEPMDEKSAREFIATNVEKQIEMNGFGDHIPVIIKTKQNIIGHLVFHRLYPPYRTVEIGFLIDPAYQKKGYATEAARELIRYSFNELGMHRVIGHCLSKNLAACKVMEKLGMRLEGSFKEAVLLKGQWEDQNTYSILKDEWQK